MQENVRVRYPPSRQALPDNQLVPSYWDGFTFHLEPNKHTLFYWDIVGVPNALRSLVELRASVESTGAELVVLVDHLYFPLMPSGDLSRTYYDHFLFAFRDGCCRAGLHIIDLLELNVCLLRELKSRDCRELVMGLPDRAPIAQKTAAMARVLSQQIVPLLGQRHGT